jgi:hypothetical protein
MQLAMCIDDAARARIDDQQARMAQMHVRQMRVAHHQHPIQAGQALVAEHVREEVRRPVRATIPRRAVDEVDGQAVGLHGPLAR